MPRLQKPQALVALIQQVEQQPLLQFRLMEMNLVRMTKNLVRLTKSQTKSLVIRPMARLMVKLMARPMVKLMARLRLRMLTT